MPEKKATLLVELLTEELPPQSLAQLGRAFAAAVHDGLGANRLLQGSTPSEKILATPRRLAVAIPEVLDAAADRQSEVVGPSVKVPVQAVAGFARKHGVDVKALEQRDTPKGKVFVARVTSKGATLDAVLGGIVNEAIRKLPISKVMRWGAGEAQFVRPVHRLVMLHATRVVPGTVLGLGAGNTTIGHRFMGTAKIVLASADAYQEQLLKDGSVVVDFAARRTQIDRQLKAEAARQGGSLGSYEDLLDEVTALVELPQVYAGTFDPAFLEMPQECLILTMRQNQKYFPLFDASGKLQPKFLIVSNMKVADPRPIVTGNERVVRPRLEDARFFYDQDRKLRLEARVPQLAKVVYHSKLGTQLERVQRIKSLATRIGKALEINVVPVERAAWLCKADLLTGMVGEFPELQGIMGRYYALHDGEPREVADAIEAHYRPRFAGDQIPEGQLSCAVALADKLDAMAGLFGIGEQPTGERDPFGLRRAALGTIRIIVERKLPLALNDLVSAAFEGYREKKIGEVHTDLMEFVFARFAGYLKDQGFSTLQVEAVLAQRPIHLSVVPQQLEAVKAFQALPEAESLAAANKRVANILRQAQAKGESFKNAELKDLKEPAERALFEALRATSSNANKLFERGDYAGYLKTFAVLKAPVDAFFDSVMVMVDHEALRRNRLALLRDLRDAMNRVADISKLAQ